MGLSSESEQVDEYSRTKTIAEQAVLSPNPKCRYANLKRCAIRPAAIFGPHEDRHMPRIVDLVRRGLVKTAIGRPDTLVDW
jgi:nucleoside-diphosphate-sugar epimerase